MKIAAITKFKHGALFQLLKKHGWTQRELAKRSGVGAHVIGNCINLLNRPSESTINKIQNAFAEVGEYVDVTELFPDAYIGFQQRITHVQFADFTSEQIENFSHYQQTLLEDSQPPLPDDFIQEKEYQETIEKVLSDKEKQIIKFRFLDDMTLDTIGEKYGRTREWARQIINNSLRKIRDHMTYRPLKLKDEIPRLNGQLKRGSDGIFRFNPTTPSN